MFTTVEHAKRYLPFILNYLSQVDIVIKTGLARNRASQLQRRKKHTIVVFI